MIKVEQHVEIRKPLDEVYRFVIVDHATNHPRWDPDVAHIEQLDPGDVAKGTRFRMGRRVMGRVQESTLEVTECEPPSRVVMVSESVAMNMRFLNAFAPLDSSGTRVTFAADVDPHGPLKLMQPFLKEQFAKGLRRSLDNIRSLLESDASGESAGA